MGSAPGRFTLDVSSAQIAGLLLVQKESGARTGVTPRPNPAPHHPCQTTSVSCARGMWKNCKHFRWWEVCFGSRFEPEISLNESTRRVSDTASWCGWLTESRNGNPERYQHFPGLSPTGGSANSVSRLRE